MSNNIYRHQRSKSWIIKWRDNQGIRKAKNFSDKKFGSRQEAYKQADSFLKTIQADLVRNEYIDPHRGKITLDDFAYEVGIVKESHSPHTKQVKENNYNTHIAVSFLADKPINSINPADINKFIREIHNKRDKPYSRALVIKVYQILFGLFREAKESNLIKDNPCDTQLAKKSFPKENKSKNHYLTKFEVNALAKEIEKTHPQYATIVYLLAYSGLRSGEYRALTWEDIDFNNNTVSVNKAVTEVAGVLDVVEPKTKSSIRTIKIDNITMNRLKEHKKNHSIPNCEIVFPDSNCTNPIRGANFRNRIWNPACDKLGLTGVTPHDLRHTSVSLSVEAGVDLLAISKGLGHKDIRTTANNYSELFPHADELKAEKLEVLQQEVI